MLQTVLVVFIPSFLVLIGILLNRSDNATLRAELRAVRDELKGDIQSLRTEVHADITSLRSELHGDIVNLTATVAQQGERIARLESHPV